MTTSHHPPVPRAGERDPDRATACPEQPTDGSEVRALVEDELLVEDVSIDGMCGVY